VLRLAGTLRMEALKAKERVVAAIILTLLVCASRVSATYVHTYGGQSNLPIIDVPGPDSQMTEAIIDVPDHFLIHDLDVRINITHTNVFDLQLFLQDPFGSRICLNMYDFKDEFGTYPDYTNTIFDDEALLSIEHAEPPFTGRFRPRQPYELSLFDGRDAYGIWSLQICDTFDWDTGTLDSFELIFTTPEPASPLILALGAALLTLFRPRGLKNKP
jgi:subtilisin-like proprotein convertase family protein